MKTNMEAYRQVDGMVLCNALFHYYVITLLRYSVTTLFRYSVIPLYII